MFLESEFDDEENQTIDKNKQHLNISIDNDKETIIDADNKKNCNNDDGDKNNQQLLKNSSCTGQPLGFFIKDEINIEETCLKIENDFNDDDQEIYENNYYPSYDDDENVDDKTIINFNQISDKKDSDIIKHESNNKEFPSIIGNDSEDEDNQPLSTLIGVNKKIKINYNNDGNLHGHNFSNITENESNNDRFCSTIVTTSDKNPAVHKDNQFSNKSLDDVENQTTGNNNSNSDKVSINISVLNDQQTSRKRYQCIICSRNFSNDSNLTRHLLRHTKRYNCNVCGKNFLHNSYLTHHLLIHKGEKPHLCNICGKRFTQNCGLNKHLRRHTGEKPYQCDICSKRFTSNYALKNHLKIHRGEKSQQCYICNKIFLQRGPLKRHLKVHSREKPHQCHICDKKFTFKPVLERHLKVHTNEKSHECNICDKKFTFKYSLKRHLNVHAS